jgi:hypothetical protein
MAALYGDCKANKKVFITKSGWRQGDWICQDCSNHNWADKMNCNKCFVGLPSERKILEKFEAAILMKLEERLKQFAKMFEEQIACAKLDIVKEMPSCSVHAENDSNNTSSVEIKANGGIMTNCTENNYTGHACNESNGCNESDSFCTEGEMETDALNASEFSADESDMNVAIETNMNEKHEQELQDIPKDVLEIEMRLGQRERQIKEGKAVKDPSHPRKPIGGAYGVFLKENRPMIVASLPAGHEITDVTKEASKLWKALAHIQKKPYQETYEKLHGEWNANAATFETKT